jgi:hypothetical protein
MYYNINLLKIGILILMLAMFLDLMELLLDIVGMFRGIIMGFCFIKAGIIRKKFWGF